MAKYPIRIDLTKIKPKAPAPQNRPAPPITQKDLDRHARMQGLEARESMLVKKKPQIIRTTVNERPTPTKKGK